MFETCVRAVRSAIPSSVGDRPVRQAAREAGQDVALARGQLSDARPRPAASAVPRPPPARMPPGDDPGHRRIEVDLAGAGRPDRAGQVVRLGVLEQEAARARPRWRR